jgi:hypothetical protein
VLFGVLLRYFLNDLGWFHLPLLLKSSSSSPFYMVFTIEHLKETMSLANTLLQLLRAILGAYNAISTVKSTVFYLFLGMVVVVVIILSIPLRMGGV